MKRFFSPPDILVVANGDKPQPDLARSYAQRTSSVIALDGAADWLISIGVKPHMVIGDLDSIDPSRMTRFHLLHVRDQNTNDLEKAFDYCYQKGHHHITVLGAFGLRADHFLTNLYVMKKFAPLMRILFIDDHQCAFICPADELKIEGALQSYISLFPLNDKVGPIWTTGLEYALNGEMLTLDSRIGTLNRIRHSLATIYCLGGCLAILMPSPHNKNMP